MMLIIYFANLVQQRFRLADQDIDAEDITAFLTHNGVEPHRRFTGHAVTNDQHTLTLAHRLEHINNLCTRL